MDFSKKKNISKYLYKLYIYVKIRQKGVKMADKDLFSEINRYAREYTKEEDITKSFPYLCLKIYFPKLSDEEIDDAIQGLGSNDEGIDAFWIDHDDQIINIAQFKSVTSYKRAKEDKAEKGWFALLADVERKLKDDLYVQNCSNKRILTIG